jgi:predicted nucleic acid-binding protein
VKLADTGIWIDHFRHADPELSRTLADDMMLCHPVVIGELALGSLRNRASTLAYLGALREVAVATHPEVMEMVERHQLYGMGIGYSDAHLLASTLIDGRAELWTRDKRLGAAARKAGVKLASEGGAAG